MKTNLLNKLLRKSILISALSSFALVAGCATNYHAGSLFGGYSDKPISKNVMQVSFLGNQFTGSQQAYQYAMRRAAQVTLKRGYKYFEVLNQRNMLVHKSYTNSQGITFHSKNPKTIITYKFLAHKTTKAYDANKVLSRTTQKAR